MGHKILLLAKQEMKISNVYYGKCSGGFPKKKANDE